MKFGVVVFPGSNCDHDAYYALGEVLHQPVEFLWHQSEQVKGFDAIILPGGFSYGDYLRTGAIARFSPVMRAVEQFARAGGLVLGICNGFQILVRSGPAARRAARATPGCALSAGRFTSASKPRTRRSPPPPSPGKCCKFRSRMPTEIIFATKRRSRSWSAIIKSCFATRRRMGARKRRPIRMARSRISPVSAIASATWSA